MLLLQLLRLQRSFHKVTCPIDSNRETIGDRRVNCVSLFVIADKTARRFERQSSDRIQRARVRGEGGADDQDFGLSDVARRRMNYIADVRMRRAGGPDLRACRTCGSIPRDAIRRRVDTMGRESTRVWTGRTVA